MISLEFIHLIKGVLSPLANSEMINPNELDEALDVLRLNRQINNETAHLKMISKKKAMEILDCSEKSIDRLIADGKLTKASFGGVRSNVRIMFESLEKFVTDSINNNHTTKKA
ncbi:hypothetical protein AAEX28_04875 [Lentisphaerota bacterium WC36G]|nr:hypothetical protein LJT99_07250 [Lentisphaerae bacterium WC36]UDQ99421.1 hypothetical protein LJT99_07730 [Lentisphaerae bacterium WC36]